MTMPEECPHGLGEPSGCLVCKNGPSKPATDAPRAISGPFRARYPGVCRMRCGDPIDPGQFVRQLQAGGVCHAECLP